MGGFHTKTLLAPTGHTVKLRTFFVLIKGEKAQRVNTSNITQSYVRIKLFVPEFM